MLNRSVWWSALVGAGVALSGCGGGGDAGDSVYGSSSNSTSSSTSSSSGTQTVAGTLTLSLSSDTVTAAAPVTVTATLLDTSGQPKPSQVVSFSVESSRGTLSAPSDLTNAQGQAFVVLYPASASATGADNVVATATVAGTKIEGSKGFRLSATNVGISEFKSDLGAGSLSAYGQTNLSMTLSGVASGTPVTVSVNSTCVTKGKATLTPATVTTTTGLASFTYKDQGCGATDPTDSVQLTLSGSSASQIVSIPLVSPEASSITFTSASRESIYIKGSGYDETSTVTFMVRDKASNPLPGQTVSLDLTTFVGGLTLDGGTSVVTKKSDSDGKVTVLINSGTVPTPVRVKAALSSANINTVSSNLSVGVGLPSQLNFSLAQGTLNIEGMNRDGTTNTYSIIASDRMGNPVPAGTSINFVTEGGSIEAIRQTQLTNGLSRATANFLSAEPRPGDGRITIVVYALGEESFLDINGNNVYDAGEDFMDLGDIYLDRGFNGIFEQSVDQFVSLASGSATQATCASAANQALLGTNVSIPSRPVTCDGAWGKAYVRRAAETVLSTSTARPLWIGTPSNATALPSPMVLQTGPIIGVSTPVGSFYQVNGTALQCTGGGGSLSFLVADNNIYSPVPNNASAVGRLNPVAAGSTISLKTTKGLSSDVLSGSPVPSTLEASGAAISYQFDDTTDSGSIFITITSPSGLGTTVSVGLQKTCPTP